ncbi:MAG: hypothetical protein Q8O16_00565 [Dehalococcoidia bacterium]|nr:hypothetical protein [Dehalococcoidia bacterium]
MLYRFNTPLAGTGGAGAGAGTGFGAGAGAGPGVVGTGDAAGVVGAGADWKNWHPPRIKVASNIKENIKYSVFLIVYINPSRFMLR